MDYVVMNMHCGQQNLLDKPSLLFVGLRHLIKQKPVMYYTRILTREEANNEVPVFLVPERIKLSSFDFSVGFVVFVSDMLDVAFTKTRAALSCDDVIERHNRPSHTANQRGPTLARATVSLKLN